MLIPFTHVSSASLGFTRVKSVADCGVMTYLLVLQSSGKVFLPLFCTLWLLIANEELKKMFELKER